MTAYELYQQAKLDEAIQAALQDVKTAPTDVNKRLLLCDLLCLANDLTRVDRQLNVLAKQATDLAVGIGLYRALVRAELARQDFFESGRVPEFMESVSDVLKLHLRASIALRDGTGAEAQQILEEAEQARPHLRGQCDGQPFEDFRDLDDLMAPCLEVLTSTGKYYWVGWDQIESLEFHPPRQLRDLVWRPTQMIIRNGPEAVVYVPVLYAGTHDSADPQLRLGRGTDWEEITDGPMVGVGQRMFLVGSEDKSILSIHRVSWSVDEAALTSE